MVVLERLREKLRDLGFVPMVFNFDKPETKDFTETVRLLCNLSPPIHKPFFLEAAILSRMRSPVTSPLELGKRPVSPRSATTSKTASSSSTPRKPRP
jgi:hypothetical protein